MEIYKTILSAFLCFIWINSTRSAPLVNEDICGRTIVLKERIIGGQRVEKGEFPWMVYFKIPSNQTHRAACAGSLINSLFVLSAAHCFNQYAKDNPQRIKSYLGISNIKTEENVDPDDLHPIRTGKTIRVARVVSYDRYIHEDDLHDVALVRLQEEVIYSAYIRPICLPVPNTKHDAEIFEGDTATIAGWGCTVFGGLTKSENLLKVSVQLRPLRDCGVVNFMEWSEHRLCAGLFNVRDACRGDSGGPLMADFHRDRAQRYFHFGVISSQHVGMPHSYPRTTYYLRWVLGEIERNYLRSDTDSESC